MPFLASSPAYRHACSRGARCSDQTLLTNAGKDDCDRLGEYTVGEDRSRAHRLQSCLLQLSSRRSQGLSLVETATGPEFSQLLGFGNWNGISLKCHYITNSRHRHLDTFCTSISHYSRSRL